MKSGPQPKAEARVSLRTVPWRKIVSFFRIGFLAAVTLDSLGAIPAHWHSPVHPGGTFLITVALAGIGLSLRPADLRRAGHCPLLLGALLWPSGH